MTTWVRAYLLNYDYLILSRFLFAWNAGHSNLFDFNSFIYMTSINFKFGNAVVDLQVTTTVELSHSLWCRHRDADARSAYSREIMTGAADVGID